MRIPHQQAVTHQDLEFLFIPSVDRSGNIVQSQVDRSNDLHAVMAAAINNVCVLSSTQWHPPFLTFATICKAVCAPNHTSVHSISSKLGCFLPMLFSISNGVSIEHACKYIRLLIWPIIGLVLISLGISSSRT